MKMELPDRLPQNYSENWPGQYKVFSHYETTLGIPHVLFLITTTKENGLPNVSYGGWSSFSGDGGGFFAIVPVMTKTHTCGNILRSRQFVVNFIDYRLNDKAWNTVWNNADDVDELAAAGFTPEQAATVAVPRIAEAFLSLECTLHSQQDLSGLDQTTLIIGRVNHAALDERFKDGMGKYGADGFMLYLNELLDWESGNKERRRYSALNAFPI